MMKELKHLPFLPEKIKVRIIKEGSRDWVAELPEYDSAFTGADNLLDLLENINDLVFTIFEIPLPLRKLIRFTPPLRKTPFRGTGRPIFFQPFYQQSILKETCAA